MKSIDIKGKEYIPVNERVKEFHSIYPDWVIETEILEFGDVVLMKATIKNEIGRIMATGHAYERENSTFINKTSYVENCETSAVGRALGLLGIGIDTAFASADEVANAVKQQEEPADERPWLSAKQFQQALDRIRTGKLDGTPDEFIRRITTEFKMKKDYRIALQEEIKSDFNKSIQ